jgi:ribosome-binding protein aMBF1 (putative translation factor)
VAAETGAERYFHQRQRASEYATAYKEARRQIDDIDRIVRTIDERRLALGLTKAELARRIGSRPESVRRLLSTRHSNPTLATVIALAHELDLDILALPAGTPVTPSPSAAAGTRRRSA